VIFLHKLRLFIKICIILFVLAIISVISLYIYAYLSPKIVIKNANSIFIYDRDSNLVYHGSSTKKWVKLEEVSQDYINAVISIEDKNFYEHNGFDYPRIIAALWKNITNKKIVEGASTISQQYIKNLYQNFDKTVKRKWKETLLTLNLEVHYDKDDILEGYINTINFGQGNIGIYNASRFYFNKDPKDITTEEAIILAGIPKSPNNYNPVTNYENSIKRAKTVLNMMVNNKKISREKAKSMFKEKIEIYGKNDKEDLNMLMYYQDAVMSELNNKIKLPKKIIQTKGIKIYTSLDMNAQKNLEKNIYNYMNNENMQVASMIIEPKSGEITALTGGLDYSKSQYNRAINAKRQVGSTMKTFLYYAALENNLTSASCFGSEPSTFTMENGKLYSPQNYGNIYANKDITMSAAISLSDNIYAIKTNMFLGGQKLIDVAKRSGIKEKLTNIPSLPLGTIEIKMIDYAQGYQTIANEGELVPLHIIRKIEDSDGNTLYEAENNSYQTLNYNYTYIISEMLNNTYNEKFKDYTNPTLLTIKNKLKEKYAIKTGTTNTDFWTIGYNKDKLMLVWTGYDNGDDVPSSKSYYTKNIFADTIESVSYDNNESSWYDMPDDVVAYPLNPITGKKEKNNKNTSLFYFVKGSELAN